MPAVHIAPPIEPRPLDAIQALHKPEIDAPAHFVSVFHETKEEFLSSIAREGLTPGAERTNLGGGVTHMNEQLDRYRPHHLVALGISRTSSIYAYPFLDMGHGLRGADQRFIPRRQDELEDEFGLLQRYSPDHLRQLGTLTLRGYADKVTSLDYLRATYPGEVLELKINPDKAVVIDLDEFTNIASDRRRGWLTDTEMHEAVTNYWAQAMTLSDFRRWYKVPEYLSDDNNIKDSSDFKYGDGVIAGWPSLVKGAPESLPSQIHVPEILIAGSVPAEHMRLLPG